MDKKSFSHNHAEGEEFSISMEKDDSLENPCEEGVFSQEEEGAPENDVETEIAELKDQLLRALAETENVRKRAFQEKEEALKYGVTSFARDILSIADTLRRALEHIEKQEKSSESLKPLVEGIEMTEKELFNLFSKYHVKKIDALGKKFDSHFHQAMFEQEVENQDPGMIVQVIQEGYMLHERLLRPSLVGVSKRKSS